MPSPEPSLPPSTPYPTPFEQGRKAERERHESELQDTCMCDGGGGILHTPSMRCTSGPYVELLAEVERLKHELRIALPCLSHAYGDTSEWVRRVEAMTK